MELTTTRVNLYRRVSRDAQARDGTSLETQREQAQAYCAERGWSIVYDDVEVYTGEDLWGRDALTRVRERVRRGDIDVVLAHSIDRLTRNQNHMGILLDEFERFCVRLDFTTEDFEQTTIGKAVANLRAMAAELEREKLIERTQRGLRKRVTAGKPLVGIRPPYGYLYAGEGKTRLVKDPATQHVVEMIFTRTAAGHTLRSTAFALTERGIPTPTGSGVWWHPSLVLILKNTVYYGDQQVYKSKKLLVLDRERGLVKRQVMRPDAERVVLEGVAEPYVDKATWTAIQARLQQNRVAASRNMRHPEAALLRGGIARCGRCNASMGVVYSKANGGYAYRCPQTTKKRCVGVFRMVAPIDADVWERCRAMLTEPERLIVEVEQRLHSDSVTQHAESLRRALEDVTRAAVRTARAIGAVDDADAEPLLVEMRRLGERKRALTEEYERAAQQQASVAGARAEVEALCARLMAESVAVIDEFSFADKRRAVEALGIRVTINPGKEPWNVVANLPGAGFVDTTCWITVHKAA